MTSISSGEDVREARRQKQTEGQSVAAAVAADTTSQSISLTSILSPVPLTASKSGRRVINGLVRHWKVLPGPVRSSKYWFRRQHCQQRRVSPVAVSTWITGQSPVEEEGGEMEEKEVETSLVPAAAAAAEGSAEIRMSPSGRLLKKKKQFDS
jgi:hypothetical protein